MYIVTVNDEKCVGCSECANNCPISLFTMEDGTLYSEYRMYDAISARQAQWANGIRNIWRLSPRLSLQTGAEHLKVLDGSDRSATAITTGIQWQPRC